MKRFLIFSCVCIIGAIGAVIASRDRDPSAVPQSFRILFSAAPIRGDVEIRLFAHRFAALCGTAQWNASYLLHADADGWTHFRVPPDRYSLVAKTPALGELTTNVSVPGPPFTAAFPSGLTLHGFVFDVKGSAVSDATVFVVPEDPDYQGSEQYAPAWGGKFVAREVKTNGRGEFEALGLPPGRYWVTAWTDATSWGPAAPADAGQRDLRLALTSSRRLAGRVTLSDGRPLPSALVVLRAPHGSVVRRAEGTETRIHTYAVTNEHGQFSIPVWSDEPQLVQAVFGCDASVRVEKTPNGVPVQLALAPPASVHVSVRMPSNMRSYAHANPEVADGSSLDFVCHSEPRETTTGETQEIDISNVSLLFRRIRIEARGYVPVELNLPLSSGPNELGPIELKPGFSVAGMVEGKDGRPVPKTEVSCRSDVDLRFKEFEHTDSEGKFECHDFPPGNAIVFVTEYEDSTRSSIQGEAGERKTIRMVRD